MTHEEEVRAKELLKNLLPEARALSVKRLRTEVRNKMAEQQQPFLTEENAIGVHIYHANLGGWIADINFRVPLGIPNCIGTPVHSPHKTYNEARDMAVTLLSFVIANTEKQKANPSTATKAVFKLYDMEFSIDLDDIENIATAQSIVEDKVGYGSVETAVRRLEEVLKDYFGAHKPSHKRLLKLNRMDQVHIYSACVMCLMSGVIRYPPREPAILEE